MKKNFKIMHTRESCNDCTVRNEEKILLSYIYENISWNQFAPWFERIFVNRIALTAWKLQKFSHQHFFTKISWNQQINTYLKSNDFTEFSQKMAAQCENHWNLHSHSLGKNFVKATFLLSKELISRIFLWWENISRFYTLCIVSVEITVILSHTYFGKNFVKATFFTKEIGK